MSDFDVKALRAALAADAIEHARLMGLRGSVAFQIESASRPAQEHLAITVRAQLEAVLNELEHKTERADYWLDRWCDQTKRAQMWKEYAEAAGKSLQRGMAPAGRLSVEEMLQLEIEARIEDEQRQNYEPPEE